MQKDNHTENKDHSDFDWDALGGGKYNTSIVLTEADKKSGTRVLCKESYAQEVYDLYREYESRTGIELHTLKDLQIGQLYEVTATTIHFAREEVKAVEKNTGIEIAIPFKEYSGNLDKLKSGENTTFKVILTRANDNCEFIGSEKKSRTINYRDEMLSHHENNTWFEVTINKLIKGGYIATYKNEIECFIPGSQAGANVIKDFSVLLGKTINVMVDNYDKSNDLFIVSYKKYIKHSLPTKVSDLRFGKLYSGKLTNKPYDFGVFVELENYYTGLVHSSDFENYEEVKRNLRAGDNLDVYVKGVSYQKKKNQYRIVLSLNKDSIPEELIKWDQLKDDLEGNEFDFTLTSEKRGTIEFYYNGDSIGVTLDKKYLKANLDQLSKIKIHSVDPLNKSFSYSLI
jgi:ribosomal protein S1